MDFRTESDSMGEVTIPEDALYGTNTARAIENFPVSGEPFGRPIIRALGQIKSAAASVNRQLGKLDPAVADAIVGAATKVVDGEFDSQFPVDVFQTGSGTSTNMNANEVIANLANLALGGSLGEKSPVHPNDHVNMGQSSNDVFPTAVHVAALAAIENSVLPALRTLLDDFHSKSVEFDEIVKVGRTHLQDATPIRLGQEFSAYVSQLEHGIEHLQTTCEDLRELPIGGTAVGTGLNTHREFGSRVATELSSMVGVEFVEADNHFEAQAARDAAVRVSGAFKSIAASLIKIANDIRWLASGPRAGLAEIKIPKLQPGSSIMPGKVNPVVVEAIIQAAVQVIGNDATITIAGSFGNFQLNVMQPLIARNLLEQATLLSNSANVFAEKVVRGITACEATIAQTVENSTALATVLAPIIGYDRAADIAIRADAEGKSIREIALEENILPNEELDRILDPARMTGPDQ